jgi:hypothetical protein
MARAGVSPQRRSPGCEEGAGDIFGAQAFQQAKDLPLASSHFPAGIQVNDTHESIRAAL